MLCCSTAWPYWGLPMFIESLSEMLCDLFSWFLKFLLCPYENNPDTFPELAVDLAALGIFMLNCCWKVSSKCLGCPACAAVFPFIFFILLPFYNLFVFGVPFWKLFSGLVNIELSVALWFIIFLCENSKRWLESCDIAESSPLPAVVWCVLHTDE